MQNRKRFSSSSQQHFALHTPHPTHHFSSTKEIEAKERNEQNPTIMASHRTQHQREPQTRRRADRRTTDARPTSCFVQKLQFVHSSSVRMQRLIRLYSSADRLPRVEILEPRRNISCVLFVEAKNKEKNSMRHPYLSS